MIFKLVILAILIWSFFQVKIASTAFIILIVLIEGYQFFIDKIGKPKNNRLKLSDDEFKVLQKYHVYFRFPFASRSVSSTLSAIQLSSFIWVPWLLYNHLWWQAAFIVVNYFIAAHFAFKLNPRFFLHDAVEKKGKLEFEPEMNAVDSLVEKIFKKKTIIYKSAERKRVEENKERILELFKDKNKITNDEVQKSLGVSDATATRYLDELEKERKIRQVGKTGKHVYYEIV